MEHNQRPQDVRARGGDEIRVSKHPLSLPRVAEIVHGALKEASTHNDATNSPGACVFCVLIFFRARFLACTMRRSYGNHGGNSSGTCRFIVFIDHPPRSRLLATNVCPEAFLSAEQTAARGLFFPGLLFFFTLLWKIPR